MKHHYYYPNRLINLATSLIICIMFYVDRIYLFVLIDIVVNIVLLFKKYYIYYPYFSSLHISDGCVERHILGFVHTSLSLTDIHVTTLTLDKDLFIVFSVEKLEHYWIGSVASLCRKRRAIMYPITEQLRRDLPDLVGEKYRDILG